MPAAWNQRSTQRSGSDSSQKTLPDQSWSGSEASSERRPQDRPLSQARLDRIAHPTSRYHQMFFRWVVAFSTQPEKYPAREMKHRLEEVLGPRLCRLKLQVMQPEETLTADEWERLEDELQTGLAQADAMARVLELRARPAASQWRAGTGSRATCWPAEATWEDGAASTDPFADA
jgi:hypothetical protein